MLKNLPLSLLQATQKTIESNDVLESCVSCGAVVGSCTHTDGLQEDDLSQQNVPDEDKPEEQLSGEKEEVIINPEYKTFTSRRPY
jgi:hypothetical protein